MINKEMLISIVYNIVPSTSISYLEELHKKVTKIVTTFIELTLSNELCKKLLHYFSMLYNLILSYLEGCLNLNIIKEDRKEFKCKLSDLKKEILILLNSIEEITIVKNKMTLFSSCLKDTTENLDTSFKYGYAKNNIFIDYGTISNKDIIYKKVPILPIFNFDNIKVAKTLLKLNEIIHKFNDYLILDNQIALGLKSTFIKDKNRDGLIIDSIQYLNNKYKEEFLLVSNIPLVLYDIGYSYYWITKKDNYSVCNKLISWDIA